MSDYNCTITDIDNFLNSKPMLCSNCKWKLVSINDSPCDTCSHIRKKDCFYYSKSKSTE